MGLSIIRNVALLISKAATPQEGSLIIIIPVNQCFN